jgi:hypothetical protein
MLGSTIATQWFKESMGHLLPVLFVVFFFKIFPIFRDRNKALGYLLLVLLVL